MTVLVREKLFACGPSWSRVFPLPASVVTVLLGLAAVHVKSERPHTQGLPASPFLNPGEPLSRRDNLLAFFLGEGR